MLCHIIACNAMLCNSFCVGARFGSVIELWFRKSLNIGNQSSMHACLSFASHTRIIHCYPELCIIFTWKHKTSNDDALILSFKSSFYMFDAFQWELIEREHTFPSKTTFSVHPVHNNWIKGNIIVYKIVGSDDLVERKIIDTIFNIIVARSIVQL